MVAVFPSAVTTGKTAGDECFPETGLRAGTDGLPVGLVCRGLSGENNMKEGVCHFAS